MEIKTNRIVLGEGEIAGHKHVLESNGSMGVIKEPDAIHFRVDSTGVLTHDEHDRMVFSPGEYVSYHQVEFNPMDGKVEFVFD